MKYMFMLLVNVIVFAGCGSSRDKTLLIENRGNLISYTSCGKGDTTLLFVHGWGINKEYWQGQLDFFCPRYKVVAIDLPGFGQSGKNLDSTWSFADYTEDVKVVIEKLNLANVILIGHSMSGDILLDADRRYPELLAGIVGIDNLHQPAAPYPEEELKQIELFFSTMNLQYDSIVRNVMAVSLFQPATDTMIKQRVVKDILAADPALAVKVLKSNSYFSQQQQDAMQGLQHKLCLVNSDVFPVNKDSLNKYCARGIEVELLHGSGHYPMLEMPAEFNAALQRIIDRLSAK